jgi:putative ABC transport system substrate-binding protein
MRRRGFLAVGIVALAVPAVGRGQRKTPVIGLLWNDSVKPSPFLATLLGALGEKGYALGRDFRIEDRISLDGYGSYAESAADLVHAKVDLIVAYGSTATFAAAKATKHIPIVMIIGSDPVAGGLAASLSRPGGNITGIATLSAGQSLIGKRFELLKELAPGVTRIGVVLAPNIGNPAVMRESEAAAQKFSLQLRFAEPKGPAEMDGQIAELVQAGAGAIYVTGATLLASHAPLIVAAVEKHRIPAVYSTERYIEAGGLMTYSASVRKAFVRAAGYVDRILKGARAGELAIEQSSDVELAVNLKTAKAMGIRIPPTILVRADRVIE